MVTIKTEAASSSGAGVDDVNVIICASGESPLPVVLRDGARVTIENIAGKAFLVGDKKDREEASETIQVYVYDLWWIKKSPVYTVKPWEKVLMLKYQIFERDGIELRRQCLSVDGKDLNDVRSFADQNIRNLDDIKLYVNN